MNTQELIQQKSYLQSLLDNPEPDKVGNALTKFYKKEFVTVEEFNMLKERYKSLFAGQRMTPWGEIVTEKRIE